MSSIVSMQCLPSDVPVFKGAKNSNMNFGPKTKKETQKSNKYNDWEIDVLQRNHPLQTSIFRW